MNVKNTFIFASASVKRKNSCYIKPVLEIAKGKLKLIAKQVRPALSKPNVVIGHNRPSG